MLPRSVQLTAIIAAFSTIVVVGWAHYLFNEEDYYAESGTVAFYPKLSSLVRSMPHTDAVSTPVYRGSIGDGPKPPQSSVCYVAQSRKEIWILSNIRTYLQKEGYVPDSSDTSSRLPSSAERDHLHYTTYSNGEGQTVDLVIHASRKPQEVDVCITHYE